MVVMALSMTVTSNSMAEEASDSVSQTAEESTSSPESSSSVKSTVSTMTSKVISFGKNMISGVSSGVTEGRKEGEAADGAMIVSNREELDANVKAQLLRIYPADSNNEETDETDKKLIAELSFKNDGDKPVRLVNLLANGSVLIIDKDGYSYKLPGSNNPDEVTVPEHAAVKTEFVFKGEANDMKIVRLWGKELMVIN